MIKGSAMQNFRYLLAGVVWSLPLLFGITSTAGERDLAKKPKCQADLCVGPGHKIRKPSEAAQIATDGQTVHIDAGDYVGDVAMWPQNNLTIRGINGRAHLIANGVNFGGKGTWIVKGSNTTIENVEFSGARVAHRNGAGIRFEGKDLTIRNCYFHHNENGILGGNGDEGDVLIENSEFAYNGFGDGQSHNIYIGRIGRLTVRFSYLHHAKVGHNLKSRARENHIMYNRIIDEADGTASYEVNLPEGGLAYLIGNVIQQGPKTENSTIISYGEEGLRKAPHEFYFASNSVINDGPRDSRFIRIKSGTEMAVVVNNVFAGPGKLLEGFGDLRNNLVVDKSDFVAADKYSYLLTAKSPAIDAGIDPGEIRGVALTPSFQYVHPLQSAQRKIDQRLDLGAFEQ